MKCDKCSKNDAVIRMTRIKGGVVEELNVCQECAAEISPYQSKLAMKPHLSVESLLKDILEGTQAAKVSSSGGVAQLPGAALECPTCGLAFGDYKKTLMLGCPECYDAFGDPLLADLKKIHGATEHVEMRRRSDSQLSEFQARHRALTTELNDSVENEEFDRAAQLRDQLRQIEDDMSDLSGHAAEN